MFSKGRLFNLLRIKCSFLHFCPWSLLSPSFGCTGPFPLVLAFAEGKPSCPTPPTRGTSALCFDPFVLLQASGKEAPIAHITPLAFRDRWAGKNRSAHVYDVPNELFMICVSTQWGAVVAYDFQLQGALTDLGVSWQCHLTELHFSAPAKQVQHQSPDTEAQWDF